MYIRNKDIFLFDDMAGYVRPRQCPPLPVLSNRKWRESPAPESLLIPLFLSTENGIFKDLLQKLSIFSYKNWYQNGIFYEEKLNLFLDHKFQPKIFQI